MGLATAELLASKGIEVWVIESQERIDYDISPTFRWRHAAWIKEFKINTISRTHALEVTQKGLRIRDKDGNERLIEVGTVILAGPRVSIQELSTSLEYAADEIYIVGDAIKPRFMYNAIHEGYKLGARV